MALNYLVDAMVSSIKTQERPATFGDHHSIISKGVESKENYPNILPVHGESDDKNRAPTDSKFKFRTHNTDYR